MVGGTLDRDEVGEVGVVVGALDRDDVGVVVGALDRDEVGIVVGTLDRDEVGRAKSLVNEGLVSQVSDYFTTSNGSYVVFSSSATSLKVAVNTTTFNTSHSCALDSIFSTASSIFGYGASCVYTGGTTATVYLGSGAKLTPGDQVSFSTDTGSALTVIASGTSLQPSKIDVVYRAYVSACSSITFDASGSLITGGGVYEVTYNWTVDSGQRALSHRSCR
jgi:hypothetical protein